jgi:hypothetical protein
MSPTLIPWLLCGALCILPLMVGTGVFFAWCQFTNRIPSRDMAEYLDDDGHKHVRTEWVMLTRQERKFRLEPEEPE